ncbi:MAG: glycosyltransferase family 1 protein [Anaerolineae bacterium]
MNPRTLHVELVGPPSLDEATGIGRTMASLMHPVENSVRVDVTLARQRTPPLSNRFTPLRQLPIGLKDHRANAIVHFAQIVGCAQLLWNPVHPSVVTVHDLGVHVCPEDSLMFNPMERTLLELQFRGMRRADAFICVSHYTARSLVTVFGIDESRVRTAYHSIDRTIFRPVPNAQDVLKSRFGLEFEPGQYTLLYVGNELPRKNLGALFEAMAIVRARGVRLRLIKVSGPGGDRWRQRTLSLAARHGLEAGKDILFVGRVSDDDLPYFHCAADAFITPSLLEGFGLPVAEAMACGTPVLCSNAGALPEIAGNAAALFDPRDPAEMADQILRVLDDPEWRAHQSRQGLERTAVINREAENSPLLALYEQLSGLQPDGTRALQTKAL